MMYPLQIEVQATTGSMGAIRSPNNCATLFRICRNPGRHAGLPSDLSLYSIKA
jgi:hypothetical protein